MSATDLPTISVSELRQNPAGMIREVRMGREYVLTDRGVPTARISPYVQQRWVRAEDVPEVLQGPVDDHWLAELDEERTASGELEDPWGRQ